MLLNFIKLAGWQVAGRNFSWMNIFWVGIVRVGVILGDNFVGGNCPGGIYPGREFSGRNGPVEIIQVATFRVGVFMLLELFYIDFMSSISIHFSQR